MELSKQAQVTVGRWGKVVNPCGPLTLDIYSQFSVIPIVVCNQESIHIAQLNTCVAYICA